MAEKTVKCRMCNGDHLALKCPNKDTLMKNLMDERKTTVGGGPGTSQQHEDKSMAEKTVRCPMCNGDHLALKCPKKDTLMKNLMDERKTTLGGGPGTSQQPENKNSSAVQLLSEEEFKIMFARIADEENGSGALDILYIASYFQPNRIHIDNFSHLFGTKQKLDAAIKLLEDNSIIDPDYGDEVFDVSTIVQNVIRFTLKYQKKVEEVLEKAVLMLSKKGINSCNVDHAMSTWSYACECHKELVKKDSDFPILILICLDNQGRHKEAYEFANSQLVVFQNYLGAAHISTLKLKSNMAMMMSNCGKYQEALDTFQEVYLKLQSKGNAYQEYTLTAQHNIGYTLALLGRDEEASCIYKEVYDKRRKLLGENHPDTLLTQGNIFVILARMDLDNIGNSVNSVKDIYKKQKELVGPENPSTLTTQHNLGAMIGSEQGKHEESLKLLIDVWHKRKALLGPDHLTTLITSSEVAQILLRQGKLNECLEILHETLEKLIKSYGEEHPETLRVHGEIGMVLFLLSKDKNGIDEAYKKQKEGLGSYHPLTLTTKYILDIGELHNIMYTNSENVADKLMAFWRKISSNKLLVKHFTWLPRNIIRKLTEEGRYGEAINFGQLAVVLLTQVIGINHLDTLHVKYNLATALNNNGRFEEAFQMYEVVYKRTEEMLGPDDELNLSLQNNMALCLLEIGRYQDALVKFTVTHKKQKKALGPNHHSALATQSNIARVLDKLGRYDRAAEVYKEVYNREKEIRKPDDPQLLTLLHNMAALLSRQQKFDEALEMFRVVSEKRSKILGNDHPETLTTQNNIGRVLGDMRMHQEALDVLEDVYNKRKKVLGPNNLSTLNTQNLKACVLNNQCKYQEALSLYEKIYPKLCEMLGSNHPEVISVKQFMDVAEFQCMLKTVIPNKNQSLLHSAAREGNLKKVKCLIKTGANVNIKDDDGSTPLHWAAHNGHVSVVKLLLENGADPAQRTKKGNTPLHIAISKSCWEISKILLYNVDRDKVNEFINAKTTSSGSTSLHVAVKNNSLDITKSLLSQGAVYNIQNHEGKSPLDIAKDKRIYNFLKLVEELFEDASKNNDEVISKLRGLQSDEFVAVTNARNNEGNSLLQVAIVNKNMKIADKLLELMKST